MTFDSDLFNKDEAYYDNFVTPIVRVDYQRNRQDQFTEKQLERVYVAGKGKLSWNVKAWQRRLLRQTICLLPALRAD